MAGKNIGPTIGLGGEAEFREQIKNINAEIGVLQAELEKSAIAFSENEQSENALAEKTRILSDINTQLEQAISATRTQYEKVAEKYGEHSIAALNLEKNLTKLESQILSNNKSLELNADALNDTSQKLDENVQTVSFWSQEVQNEFHATADVINGALEGIKAGLSFLNEAVTSSGETADKIVSAADKAGMSTQSYQELQYAAEKANVSIDTITDSITDLGEKAFDAVQEPTSETAELFRELGVSLTDSSGKLVDSQEIWENTVLSLGNMGNETERNAVATKLFGSAAKELSVFMGTQGVQTLQLYKQEAQNVGAVLDNDTIKSLDALNETQRKADATIQGVKDRLSAQLAPAFAKAAEAAANLLVAFEPLIADALDWALQHIPEIATGVMALVGAIIAMKIVSTLTPLISIMNSNLMQTNVTLGVTNATMLSNPLVMIISAIVGALVGLVAGIALFNEKSDEISEGMDDMSKSMKEVGNSAEELEEGVEEVVNNIDWESINLDFETKFAILGSNSAAAFKKNLLEGFNGFENDLTNKLSGMELNLSPGSSGGNNYTPVIKSAPTSYQNIDITLCLDKYTVAEILFDPLTGVAKQKGVT